MIYTMIGYWDEDGRGFIEYIEAPNAREAVIKLSDTDYGYAGGRMLVAVIKERVVDELDLINVNDVQSLASLFLETDRARMNVRNPDHDLRGFKGGC